MCPVPAPHSTSSCCPSSPTPGRAPRKRLGVGSQALNCIQREKGMEV